MPQIRPSNKRGFLVVFEGIDRSGKSTQAKMIYDRLIREGHAAELFRFPDRSTTVGGILNSYLAGAENCSSRLWPPQLLHLLFSANRWEAQPKLYEALNRGAVVIVDRYSFSGVAYSIGAAPAAAVAALNNLRRPTAASAAAAAIAGAAAAPTSDAAAAAAAHPSASAAAAAAAVAATAAAASIPITSDFCLKTEEGLLAPDLVIYLDLSPREAHIRCGFGSELYEKVGIQEKVHAAYQQFQSLPYWHSVAAGHNTTAAELHEKIYQRIREALSACKDACSELPSSRKLLWDK